MSLLKVSLLKSVLQFAASSSGRQRYRIACSKGDLAARQFGASGSLRGKPSFAQFASPMSGLRMVAQSAAREFGPAAIHVAHVVIDGGVASDQLKAVLPNIVERLSADGLLSVDDIAQNYWMLHTQPRTVWTQNWTGDRSRSRSTGAGGSHPW